MKTISTHDAKTHLSRYLTDIEETGEEYIIARGQRPIARLIPLERKTSPPRPRVGEMLGEPGEVPADALRPLSEEELADWGI
jgi:antitoxin (DNA-binding transcriptional repressor) of toxin-antitoxin stability system